MKFILTLLIIVQSVAAMGEDLKNVNILSCANFDNNSHIIQACYAKSKTNENEYLVISQHELSTTETSAPRTRIMLLSDKDGYQNGSYALIAEEVSRVEASSFIKKQWKLRVIGEKNDQKTAELSFDGEVVGSNAFYSPVIE